MFDFFYDDYNGFCPDPAVISFTNNVFTSNTFHGGNKTYEPYSANFNMTGTPAHSQLEVGNNTFSDNDFGNLLPPYFNPTSMIIDGGGNICKSPSAPLVCTPPSSKSSVTADENNTGAANNEVIKQLPGSKN